MIKDRRIFSGASGEGGGGGAAIKVVNTYADLPAAATKVNKFYFVKTTTGSGIGVKPAGLYYSDGTTWYYDDAYTDIVVVANYSALPPANTVTGSFYWCENSQGTSWLPGPLGGTYYNSGLYYSNGVSWEYMETPYQATQSEVDAGTVTDKFVSPNTLANTSKWGDYLPLAGGTMDTGADIFFANGSRISEGTTDAGLGGAAGIALTCSIDYELKWDAGSLYVMEQNGFTIREVRNKFNLTPTATDDNTKGFVVNSRWVLDNGDTYVCANATTGAAVWNLEITNGSILYGIASGTDTYTTTITGVTSYNDGDAYLIRFTNGNTAAAPTLNINSIGAVTLYRNNDGQLLGGDIVASGEMLCVYDSTLNVFKCIGTSPNTLFAYVTNGDSVSITKGQPVYAFSGTGDRMVVKLANNTADATSAKTIGLVYSTSIAANQKGLIIIQGLLDGLSTLPTATWTDGDTVYLGATSGAITKTKPYAPNHLVYLGVVTTASNGAAGRMYVKVQNGYELDEIHDVDLISVAPVNNDVLTYATGTNNLWKPRSIATILGYTPANQAQVTSMQSAVNLFNYYNFM